MIPGRDARAARLHRHLDESQRGAPTEPFEALDVHRGQRAHAPVVVARGLRGSP